jgi:hypothetical protein
MTTNRTMARLRPIAAIADRLMTAAIRLNLATAARISSISVAIGFGIALGCGAPAAADELSAPPPAQCQFDNPIPLEPAKCLDGEVVYCSGIPEVCRCIADPDPKHPLIKDESPPRPGATAVLPPGTDKRGIQ